MTGRRKVTIFGWDCGRGKDASILKRLTRPFLLASSLSPKGCVHAAVKRWRVLAPVALSIGLALGVGLLWALFRFLADSQQNSASDLLARSPGYTGDLPLGDPQRYFGYLFAAGLVLVSAFAAWRFRSRRVVAAIAALLGLVLALSILLPWSPLAGTFRGQQGGGGQSAIKGSFSPLYVALFFAWCMVLLALALISGRNRWAKPLFFILLLAPWPLLLAGVPDLLFSRPSDAANVAKAYKAAYAKQGEALRSQAATDLGRAGAALGKLGSALPASLGGAEAAAAFDQAGKLLEEAGARLGEGAAGPPFAEAADAAGNLLEEGGPKLGGDIVGPPLAEALEGAGKGINEMAKALGSTSGSGSASALADAAKGLANAAEKLRDPADSSTAARSLMQAGRELSGSATDRVKDFPGGSDLAPDLFEAGNALERAGEGLDTALEDLELASALDNAVKELAKAGPEVGASPEGSNAAAALAEAAQAMADAGADLRKTPDISNTAKALAQSGSALKTAGAKLGAIQDEAEAGNYLEAGKYLQEAGEALLKASTDLTTPPAGPDQVGADFLELGKALDRASAAFRKLPGGEGVADALGGGGRF